jgi:hypothetical protein
VDWAGVGVGVDWAGAASGGLFGKGVGMPCGGVVGTSAGAGGGGGGGGALR